MASDLGKDAACCSKGDSWDGEPTGSIVKIGDLITYLAKPPQPSRRGVLLVSDVYGWDLKNARLFADAVARAGFICALPDFFHGDKLPAEKTGEAFGKFISANPFEPAGRTAREIDAVVAELREKHGAKAVGAQGFCWGGYHVIHTAQHAGKLGAVVIAHGSRMDLPMIEAMQTPALFACPENDSQMDAKFRGEVEEAMAKKPFPARVDLYKGMGHGFTLRPHFTGNAAEDEALKAASEEALQKSIAWFDEHLAA